MALKFPSATPPSEELLALVGLAGDAAGTVVIVSARDLASANPIDVAIVDGTGAQITSFGGGTQYAEDTAHVSGDQVTMAGVVQQTADAALSTDGDRSLLQVDASGFLKVNVKAGGGGGIQYTEGDVDATITGTAVMWEDAADTLRAASTAKPLPVRISDGTDLVLITAAGALVTDGSGVTQPISGTVTANQGTAAAVGWEVVGEVAHDIAAAGNPVLIAARANLDEPATAVADGDSTYLWGDRLGRLVVLAGHANPEPPTTLNATASGDTTVIAAPGAGSLHILKGSVHNRATTNRVVALRDGTAGTIRWRAELAAEGGGAAFDFGDRGWKLTATTLLAVNLDAAGDVDVNITEYYIAT